MTRSCIGQFMDLSGNDELQCYAVSAETRNTLLQVEIDVGETFLK